MGRNRAVDRRSQSPLNDFLGYRPVAVLHTPQKIEPYPHEWVCPQPLYFRGAGVVYGRYHDLIAQALKILEQTPDSIRRQAYFDPALVDELALDPRAYDFDHPVNKRPNHQFGQWDPHHLDNQGHYRRFVLQEVTLEAIWQRTNEASDLPADERLFEAGAVLAGVILMASALGGQGPDSHDSTVTLAKLLPRIAACRDAFYERLLAKVQGPHGERLRAEAASLRQPFGGARQHLNQRLGGRAPRNCNTFIWRSSSPAWAIPKPAAARPRSSQWLRPACSAKSTAGSRPGITRLD